MTRQRGFLQLVGRYILSDARSSARHLAALAVDLAQAGLRLEENLSPADIQARYFSGRADGYRAFEQMHFARAGVA